MSETLLTRRAAQIAPASLDREARTFDAVIATETPVERPGYFERLKISSFAVDLSRAAGAPVLNTHRQTSIDDAIGVIEKVWIDDARLVARIRLERSAAGDAALAKVADRIIRALSIGYSVEDWIDETDAAGRRHRVAARWTLVEASLVAVPADPNSKIRSHEMPPEFQRPATPPEMNAPRAQQPAPPPTHQPAPQPGHQPPGPLNTRAAINAEIRQIARLANLDAAFTDALIDREASADQARAAAFDAMQARERAAPAIRTQTMPNQQTFDNPEFRARAIGEALYTRVAPGHKPSEESRSFVGYTMVDIARDILTRAGVSTVALSPQSLITRALQTTSDFSLILGDMTGRTLRAAYEAAPSGVRQLARETTARDFRAKHRVQLGEAPTLEKVGEGGEFKFGGMAEAKESYQLATFGKILGFSRQAIINDDLGAFADVTRRLGLAARAFENRTLTELLESNPEMSDGEDLFDAAHGNIGGSAGAPDETRLSAARLAMRSQTGLTSELISVTPKYVLVPAALETATEKLLSAVQATTTSETNPFSALQLLVEPRLTDAAAWYVAADPAEIDGLEFAYLEGEPGPQIESRNGFEIDGVQIKIRLDFGAGFVDWRGWHKNDGAGG